MKVLTLINHFLEFILIQLIWALGHVEVDFVISIIILIYQFPWVYFIINNLYLIYLVLNH